MDLLQANGEFPRVLIVEDDPVSAMLIQRLFKAQGIASDHATNGSVALEMHRTRRYYLVVSDWMMPEMDGVELCRAFRNLRGPYVYFILCSARGERAERIEAFEAGVDDFLNKPLDPDELAARLKVARRILRSEENLQIQKAELEQSSRKLQDLNETLRLASQRFEELFNGLPVACFTFDEEGLIHEWNYGAQQVFGIQAFEAFQQPVWQVLSQHADTIWSPNRIRQVFEDGQTPQFDWTYTLKGGQTRYLACSLICLRGRSGETVGAVCANLDITERRNAEERARQFADQLEVQKRELEAANEQLSHLAVTDGLTGLWNHRRFQEMLEEVIQTSCREQTPFSLVLADIDHFKRFNDDFGHQVGDEVLIRFGQTLRRTARANELPARYGGEEFAMILRHCDRERAMAAVERVRGAIRKENWSLRPVTSSLGVATSFDGEITAKEIIAQADAALYYSKQQGRDRATHYDEMPLRAAA